MIFNLLKNTSYRDSCVKSSSLLLQLILMSWDTAQNTHKTHKTVN